MLAASTAAPVTRPWIACAGGTTAGCRAKTLSCNPAIPCSRRTSCCSGDTRPKGSGFGTPTAPPKARRAAPPVDLIRGQYSKGEPERKMNSLIPRSDVRDPSSGLPNRRSDPTIAWPTTRAECLRSQQADGGIGEDYGRFRALSASFSDLSQTALDRFSHPNVFQSRTPDHSWRGVLHGR